VKLKRNINLIKGPKKIKRMRIEIEIRNSNKILIEM
jgi:hypothetical protein